MRQMDSKKLGRLAVAVRGLRVKKARHEAALTKINTELSTKEPQLDAALLSPQMSAAAIEGAQV